MIPLNTGSMPTHLNINWQGFIMPTKICIAWMGPMKHFDGITMCFCRLICPFISNFAVHWIPWFMFIKWRGTHKNTSQTFHIRIFWTVFIWNVLLKNIMWISPTVWESGSNTNRGLKALAGAKHSAKLTLQIYPNNSSYASISLYSTLLLC